MTADEQPLDLEAVTADDQLVERLRAALDAPTRAGSVSPQDAVVWDDEDDDVAEDLSYALLRALQRDVSADLDDAAPALPIVPRRRTFGRTATVAAVAAGVLSLTGVAAAATSSPGDPMYGVRSAVADAVHNALDAITPSAPVVATEAPAVATPTATVTPPGVAVSTAARSASAARQIEERIDTAERLLDRGRPTAAGEVLDQAQRRLPLVLDLGQRTGYQQQIEALRARILATPEPARGPQNRPDDRGKSDVKRPTPKASRTAPQQQRGQGGEESGQTGGSTQTSNRDERLPDLPLPAQAEEHGAPTR
jgi:hypothetical protein